MEVRIPPGFFFLSKIFNGMFSKRFCLFSVSWFVVWFSVLKSFFILTFFSLTFSGQNFLKRKVGRT